MASSFILIILLKHPRHYLAVDLWGVKMVVCYLSYLDFLFSSCFSLLVRLLYIYFLMTCTTFWPACVHIYRIYCVFCFHEIGAINKSHIYETI